MLSRVDVGLRSNHRNSASTRPQWRIRALTDVTILNSYRMHRVKVLTSGIGVVYPENRIVGQPKAGNDGIVVVLLFVIAAIFTAAQFPHQGYGWADEICFAAYGLCNHPYWLG